MITWEQYCACLRVLEKRFGKLSQQETYDGFRYWKSKEQADLMVEVDLALQTGTKPDLSKPKTIKKPPYYKPVDYEKRIISEDYMDKLIKQAGVKNLFELVQKAKKEKA